MNARRPLISAVVAIVVVSTFALVAAAGSSPQGAASAVDPTVSVGRLFFGGVTPAGSTTPVVAFDWSGKSTATTGGGAGSGKVSIGGFSFTREIDQYSHKLFRLFVTGAHTTTVSFEAVVQNGGSVAARYTFTNVIVSSFRHYANGTPDYQFPLDRITIRFRKVCVEGFAPPGGTVRGGSSAVCYNLATNIVS